MAHVNGPVANIVDKLRPPGVFGLAPPQPLHALKSVGLRYEDDLLLRRAGIWKCVAIAGHQLATRIHMHRFSQFLSSRPRCGESRALRAL